MNIKQKIISLSKQAGACSIGFADIVEVSEHWQQSFDSMVSEGRHGSMAFMERNRELRTNPALLLEGAKTLISLAFSYDKGKRHSRIASYALVQDYHYFLKQILAPITDFLDQELGAQCRICVDSAPVAERFWALRTGVGVKGRNQQLMVPGVGARVFLAEILTTAQIEPDPIITYEGYADVCIGCDQCVRACPNGALEDPEKFDARKCVSYLTIEHRGDLPTELNLAGKIYGCDICLDTCPYNHTYPISNHTSKPTSKPTSINPNTNHINKGIEGIGLESLASPSKPLLQVRDREEHKHTLLAKDTSTHPNPSNQKNVTERGCEPKGNTTPDAEIGTDPVSHPQSIIETKKETFTNPIDKEQKHTDLGLEESSKTENYNNFYILHTKVNSPFEIDTDILSLTTQDIENMSSGQYRRLTKKSAMSRCSLSQLRRNI